MSIKFARDGKEQQQWALPKDNCREESDLYSSINEHQTLHKDSWGSKIHLRNNTIPLSLSMYSSLFLFLSLSLSFSFVPFPQCSILSLYSPPPPHPHHPFLPNPLPFPTLASEEGRGRNLLSCGLYCSGHFLINAADKTIVFQLMRMQQAIPGLKHPYYPLSSTLLILTSFWMPRSTTICFLLPRATSSLRPVAYSILTSLLRPFNFLFGPQANIAILQLLPRSLGTHNEC